MTQAHAATLVFDADSQSAELLALLAREGPAGPVALDSESVGWEPGDPVAAGPTQPRPVCVTLAGQGWTAFVRLEGRPALLRALGLGLGSLTEFVGANCAFDGHCLNHPSLRCRFDELGLELTPTEALLLGGARWTDVLVLSRAEDATRRAHDLKSLGAELLGRNPPSFKRMRQEVFGIARTKPTKKEPTGRPYADGRPNPGELDDEACLSHPFFRAYALHDARNTLDLRGPLLASLERQGAREAFERLVWPHSRLAFEKELRGVPVSLDALQASGARARASLAEVRARLDARCPGVLWSSHAQVKAALAKQGLELESTAGGALVELRDVTLDDEDPRRPLVADLLEHRAVEKQVVAFFNRLPLGVHESRVHPSIRVHGAQTGRDSCANPNAQQMSATRDVWQLRRAFQAAPPLAELRAATSAALAYAAPGYLFVVADYSAIEWVLAIHLSGDEAMAYAHEAGIDPHGYTAYGVFSEVKAWVDARGGPKVCLTKRGIREFKAMFGPKRQACKTLNYAQLYGSGARTLRSQLLQSGDIVGGVRTPGVEMSLPEVEEMLAGWQHTYRGYDRWRRQLVVDIRRALLGQAEGERGVRTIGGRLRQADGPALLLYDHPDRSLRARASAEARSLVSAANQGSAADLLHLADIKVSGCPELARLGYQPLLPVHDELVGIAPARQALRAQRLVRQHMLDAASDLGVRPRVEVSAGRGRSWGDSK